MTPRQNVRPHGQVRQSQVVTTFGPGSLIDLPHHSVIVGGLETWEGLRDEIPERRLVEKLKRLLDLPQLKLFAPPPDIEDPNVARSGITVWQFPEWFLTEVIEGDQPGGPVRSRMLVHRRSLTKGVFIDDRKRKHPVVPIRFVRACSKGHIADIDWRKFAHGGDTDCRRQPLWVDERGTSGDLTELRVRCECGAAKELAAAQKNPALLGMCNGERPWLGINNREGCGTPSRLLIRSASNAYFSQTMGVISLPEKDEAVEKAVGSIYSAFLENLDSIEELQFARKKMAPVKAALDGLDDEVVWSEVQTRKGATLEDQAKSVKQAEFEVLSGVRGIVGKDTETFHAELLSPDVWNKPWMSSVERIVLVHRLREVVAQVGFTRFESISPDVEGELQLGVQSASLALETTWLPAVENRGEGVFLQFQKHAIDGWLSKAAVIKRGKRLADGFEAWRGAHPQSKRVPPGTAYYLLHSISHTLLTAIALECGYPASSLRERVYALESGYGILIYTGTPDAEGTLGGLVEVGRNIHRHLQAALELARLCSNDPVCAQHDPTGAHEARFLHGAACHGCLLISETSCEQQNDFLDRALLVPTVEDEGAEFFPA